MVLLESSSKQIWDHKEKRKKKYFPSDQRAEILHTSLLVKGGESNAEGSEVWTTWHRSVPAPFRLLTLSAPAHPAAAKTDVIRGKCKQEEQLVGRTHGP